MRLTFEELKEKNEDKKLIMQRHDEIEKWATKLFFKNFLPDVQLSRKLIRGIIYFYIDKNEFRVNCSNKSIDIFLRGNVACYYEKGEWDFRVYDSSEFIIPTKIQNVMNYLCENFEAIDKRLVKIYNLLTATHYIDNLPKAYTFLLCSPFYRDISRLIAHKILFFLVVPSGLLGSYITKRPEGPTTKKMKIGNEKKKKSSD